jgi:hypothetical protein
VEGLPEKPMPLGKPEDTQTQARQSGMKGHESERGNADNGRKSNCRLGTD